MRESRKRRRTYPLLKGIFSLIMICILLLLGTYAVRFCLGLFVVGDDYILHLPGETMPVATVPQTPEETLPGDSGQVREVGRARILATGDLMMHMPTVRSGYRDGAYNFDYIYSYVKPYVSAADYAVVNLETTLSGTEGRSYTGYPKFNSPDAVASGAKSGGFDMMTTGNNHCNDYGTPGLLRTLEVIKGAGMDTLGTYATASEQKYVVKELGGIKVGMMSYTFGDIGDDPSRPSVNGLPTDSKAAGLVNAFDYDKLDLFYTEAGNQVSAMKAAGADAIVLFVHWGDEYTVQVNEKQKAIAQKLCDLGVDVIAGSHPHVVQTMDLLRSTRDESHQTVVIYSMGNFLSNQRATNIALTTGQSEDSLLFTVTFVKYSDGTVTIDCVDVLPTWVLIRGSGDGRTYHILPLDQTVEDWGAAFDLSASQTADARKSYNRTMDTIGAKYKEIQETLEKQKTEQNLPQADPGVG